MNEPAMQRALFGDEQEPLPTLEILPSAPAVPRRETARSQVRGQIPLMVAVREIGEWPLRPGERPKLLADASAGPGQLSFGPNQLVLSDTEPEPVQMSLLGDPQPWEPAPTPKKKRRAGGPRRKPSAIPDQTTLF